jgi:tRNA(Arg) A34 adenosine deaminase TadA
MNRNCAPQHTGILPNRRFLIAGFAGAAVLPAMSLAATADRISAEDERFMRMALDEARQGDFPFGAVIVQDGSVVARGRNLGQTNGDPTAHGEMIAIRRCLADKDDAALRGSTLYTSGEPCARCVWALFCGAG